MNVKVLLFATLKDRAGTNRFSLELPLQQASLDELKTAVANDWPALAEPIRSAVAAINQEFAFAGDPIRDGDEVAFFPPVSGGQWPESFQIAPEVIDLNVLTKFVTTPATGAVCLFTGAVRGETNAQGELIQTTQLEYEAYEPMALEK